MHGGAKWPPVAGRSHLKCGMRVSADGGRGCVQIEQAAVGLARQLLHEQFGIVAEEVEEEAAAVAAAAEADDSRGASPE